MRPLGNLIWRKCADDFELDVGRKRTSLREPTAGIAGIVQPVPEPDDAGVRYAPSRLEFVDFAIRKFLRLEVAESTQSALVSESQSASFSDSRARVIPC